MKAYAFNSDQKVVFIKVGDKHYIGRGEFVPAMDEYLLQKYCHEIPFSRVQGLINDLEYIKKSE